jgi:tetratricopeptide (TPR) repeat protein
VLAEHFLHGQERRRAIDCLIQAGEQSYDAHDMDTTLSCAERGLGCGPEGELRGALLSLQVAVYLGRERYADVLTLGAEALECLPPGGKRWCRAVQSILPAATFSGQEAVVANLGAHLGSVEPSKDAASYYVTAVSWLSIMLGISGMRSASIAFLERARTIAGTLEESDRAAWGAFKGACANSAHVLEEAPWTGMLDCREEAQAFHDAGDRRLHCIAWSYYGKTLMDLGDYAGAEAILRENLANAERLNEALPLAFARTYLSLLLAGSAPLEKLEEPARLATEVIATRNQWHAGFAWGVLSEIKLRQGDLRGADDDARTACEAARLYPTYSWVLVALRMRVLMGQGYAAYALQIGEDALQALERLGVGGFGEIHLRLAVAEARRAVGQADAACATLKKTIKRLRARVEDIPDAARERYLTAVPTHARLLALATAWLGYEAVRPLRLG